MFLPLRYLPLVLLAALFCRPARAALEAHLAPGSGDAQRGWEMIAVEFPAATSTREVSVQDARSGGSGPQIARPVPPGTTRVWLPLPLVAPSELGAGWPVHVVLRQPGGTVLEEATLSLPLGTGGSPRIASPVPLPGIDNLVPLSEEEILSAPPLLFAGCDMVYLTPDLQRRMTRARALALLVAGVRLVVGGDAPPTGELADLVWTPWTVIKDTPAWIAPAVAVRRPAILEPGVSHLAPADAATALPASALTVILLLGPAAALWLILARGLFRRRAVLALSATAGFAVLGAGAAALLHGTPPRREMLATWRQTNAGDAAGGAAGGINLTEQLTRVASPLGNTLQLESSPGQLLFPVAATLRDYRDCRTLRVVLDEQTTTLQGPLDRRHVLQVETRSAQALGLLPAFPADPAAEARLRAALHLPAADTWWLRDGYVRQAPDDAGTLLSKWAQEKPWSVGIGDWYELRYEPGHRYLLYPQAGALQILDFGPAVPPG